jgi:hypothetical protein
MVPHANLLPELPVFKLSALPPCKTKRGRYHRVGKATRAPETIAQSFKHNQT